MNTFKIKRLPQKGKLLDTYIKENIYIHRIDIQKMGYNNTGLSLYRYCVKNKINIKQKNYHMWIKTKEYSDPSLLKEVFYIKAKSDKKERNLFTYEEKQDTFILTWEGFKEKYPKRTKQQYNLWNAKMMELKAR